MKELIELFNKVLNLEDGGTTTLGIIVTIFFISVIYSEFKKENNKTFYAFCFFIIKFIVSLIPSLSFECWQFNLKNITVGMRALTSITFTGFLIFFLLPLIEKSILSLSKKNKCILFEIFIRFAFASCLMLVVMNFLIEVPNLIIIETNISQEIIIKTNHFFVNLNQYLFWFLVIEMFIVLQYELLKYKPYWLFVITIFNFILSIYFFENIYYLLTILCFTLIFLLYKYGKDIFMDNNLNSEKENNKHKVNNSLLEDNSIIIQIQRNIIRNGKNISYKTHKKSKK